MFKKYDFRMLLISIIPIGIGVLLSSCFLFMVYELFGFMGCLVTICFVSLHFYSISKTL